MLDFKKKNINNWFTIQNIKENKILLKLVKKLYIFKLFNFVTKEEK